MFGKILNAAPSLACIHVFFAVAVTDFMVSKWLGISGSGLFVSLRLSTVSGRLFTIAIA